MAKARRKPETWLDLFEPEYMYSGCGAVAEAIRGAALGAPTSMHVTLRRYLVSELDQYMAAHWKAGTRQSNIAAAQHLQTVAEDLAEKFESRYPFEDPDAPRLIAELRDAWLEFIAHGAGHRMYHDRARELAQRVWASTRPRVALTLQEMAQRMKAAGAAGLSQDMARDLAEEFHVSESTVYRRLKAARDAGLLS